MQLHVRESTQHSRVGDVSDEQYLVIPKAVSDVRDKTKVVSGVKLL